MVNLVGTASEDLLIGGAGDDRLEGLAGNDVLLGGGGADELVGGDGDDHLNGGGGADAMIGGAGDDIYFVNDAGDTLTEALAEGTDVVFADVDFVLGENLETLIFSAARSFTGGGNALANLMLGGLASDILNGGDGDDRIVGRLGDDLILGEAGDDWLIGGQGDDRLEGGEGADGLFGRDGRDLLLGGDGDDRLDGGSDGDDMRGGRGDDVYFVDDFRDVATEAFGEGVDRVVATATTTLSLHIEELVLRGGAAIGGTGNVGDNRIFGNDAANVLDGGGGNDRIDGGLGADLLIGGDGDDFLFVDDVNDLTLERAGGGIDTVVSTVTRTLGDNEERLVLRGGDGVGGTGNDIANRLIGNAAANRLDGAAGDDRIFGKDGDDLLLGGAGRDALNGGAGADEMRGGPGDDVYFVDDAGDVVIEAGTQGTGIDRVVASVTHTLAENVENLTLAGAADIDGTGNDLANRIFGNDGANVLNGGGGRDELDGGAGADVLAGGDGGDDYVVDDPGDVVVEAADAGFDTVLANVDGHRLADNVENLILGGSIVRGEGNALGNQITGNDVANVLVGAGGRDTLLGHGGDDVLAVDDEGFQRVFGGGGEDTLRIDGGGVQIDFTELPNVVARSIERLDIDGSGANTLTLNEIEVRSMSDLRSDGFSILTVEAGFDDVVRLVDGVWVDRGTVDLEGTAFVRFQRGLSEVRVEQGVTVERRAGFDFDGLLAVDGFAIQGIYPCNFPGIGVLRAAGVNGDGFEDVIVDGNGNVTLAGVRIADLHEDDFVV